MKISSVEKIVKARKPSQFPFDGGKEVAFIGRSNVGKSSLINHLLKHRGLAKTSQTPGKTRSIDFYEVNKRFFFVDLPGYGYAKLPLDVLEGWKALIESYLKDRKSLKLALVLVDIRHTPTEKDNMMVEWLKFYEQDFLVIATKSDKLSRGKAIRQVQAIEKHFGLKGNVIPFSVKDGKCREKVWGVISSKIRGKDEV